MKIIKSLLVIVTVILMQVPSSAGNIKTETISSKVLEADVTYNVYLPSGYDSTRHYPVIYLLHGLSDTYAAWKEKGNMAIVVDELIGTGELVPSVIIMPGAGGPDTHNQWNGYFNMPGWNYEDFFFTEFLPAVEKKYNVGGSKGQRAIMGLSMGGGGSTVYCQHHPDCFSSCYSMSGWLDNKSDQVNPGKKMDKLQIVCQSVRDNSALDFIRNADEGTVASLKTVKWFFDCGDDDFLLKLSVEIHTLMSSKGIKNELRVRNGVHNWEYWHTALRLSMPFASRNFF